MATQITTPLHPAVAPSASPAPAPVPRSAADNDNDFYAELRRHAAVGRNAVHPAAIALGAGGYALLLTSFWIGFGHSLEAKLVLGVVTMLMLVYFSLLLGGILLSDQPEPGEERSFTAFLKGQVETATGPLPGREALFAIAGLPMILAVMSFIIGSIAQLTLG